MQSEIRPIDDESALAASLAVIRESFATVARQQGLTIENCPSHSAFLTMDKLLELHKKATCFGLYADCRQAGFVAVEKADPADTFYLDKLAVLPNMRHKGYGSRLVKHAVDYVKKQGGRKIGLGMIDSHTLLKDWYKSLGFRQTGTKKFDHLPFVVCFMELDLSVEKID